MPKPSAFSPPNLSPGPKLALLLLAGFRALVDTATTELAQHGHPGVRAGHEFAMRAIEGGAESAVELAGRLGVSKQAAAKTIAGLEARDYVTRETDPVDGRRKPLMLTPRGRDMLAQGQAILDATRQAWAARVGEDAFAEVERVLTDLVGREQVELETAAWLIAKQE